jgi:hypothetical protein
MIAASVTGIIAVFNLTWWSLRILGLRPLLATGAAHHEPRNPTTEQLHPLNNRTPGCGYGSPAGRPGTERHWDDRGAGFRIRRLQKMLWQRS